jgi:hypothetical protein
MNSSAPHNCCVENGRCKGVEAGTRLSGERLSPKDLSTPSISILRQFGNRDGRSVIHLLTQSLTIQTYELACNERVCSWVREACDKVLRRSDGSIGAARRGGP